MNPIRLVSVTFPTGPQRYTYRTDIAGIERGDKVVVRTKHGLQIVTVSGRVERTQEALLTATAWIIDKIDFSGEIARELL